MTLDHPIGLRNLNVILEWLETCIDGVDEGRSWEIQAQLRNWGQIDVALEKFAVDFIQPDSLEKANALIYEAYGRLQRGELTRAKRALFDAGAALQPMSYVPEQT